MFSSDDLLITLVIHAFEVHGKQEARLQTGIARLARHENDG